MHPNAKFLFTAAVLALTTQMAPPLAHAQTARDTISIVGSSTVYPFTTMVAEQLGRQGKFKTPKVESTGTGGGIKLFCNGVGVQFPDMANASRRMNVGEFDTCGKNGVNLVGSEIVAPLLPQLFGRHVIVQPTVLVIGQK